MATALKHKITHQLTAGAVIAARPWMDGRELESQRAYVLTITPSSSDTMVNYGGYVMAWFPYLGELSVKELGRAVQPTLAVKATVRGEVADLPLATIAELARRARLSGVGEDLEPFRAALASALEAYELDTKLLPHELS
jgi:hypothetical protein